MERFIYDLIIPNLEATTKEEVIKTLSSKLAECGYVSKDYFQLVMEREKEYPTGLVANGAYIAIPHAFDKKIKGTHVAIGTLKNPVKFYNMENLDEEIPVEIVFLLAINEAKEQLEMLKMLMSIFKSKDLLKEIKNEKSREVICNKLNGFLSE